jgi:hypothetical protein
MTQKQFEKLKTGDVVEFPRGERVTIREGESTTSDINSNTFLGAKFIAEGVLGPSIPTYEDITFLKRYWPSDIKEDKTNFVPFIRNSAFLMAKVVKRA